MFVDLGLQEKVTISQFIESSYEYFRPQDRVKHEKKAMARDILSLLMFKSGQRFWSIFLMILLSFLLLTLGEKLESFCAKVESIRAAQPNLLNRRLSCKVSTGRYSGHTAALSHFLCTFYSTLKTP